MKCISIFGYTVDLHWNMVVVTKPDCRGFKRYMFSAVLRRLLLGVRKHTYLLNDNGRVVFVELQGRYYKCEEICRSSYWTRWPFLREHTTGWNISVELEENPEFTFVSWRGECEPTEAVICAIVENNDYLEFQRTCGALIKEILKDTPATIKVIENSMIHNGISYSVRQQREQNK